jgi:hypothetical protein
MVPSFREALKRRRMWLTPAVVAGGVVSEVESISEDAVKGLVSNRTHRSCGSHPQFLPLYNST